MVPIRQRLRARRVVSGRREQLALQRHVVELGRHRPGDPDHRRPPDVLPDRRAPNPNRSCDHPIARPAGILQAQNFPDLRHRQSLRGHRRFPLCWNCKGATLPRSDCRQRSPPHPIHRVAAFDRNRWPLSLGLGGRLPSESVAALPRIPHPGVFRSHAASLRCRPQPRPPSRVASTCIAAGLESALAKRACTVSDLSRSRRVGALACPRCGTMMSAVVSIAPVAGEPGLIAYECPQCRYATSVLQQPKDSR